MAWIMLLVAGLLEVAWATTMKLSDGFRVPRFTIATILLMISSFLLLAASLRRLPVGTAYAIWVGIGAVGVAIVGILHFGENASPLRLACIACIVLGVAGLKLAH